MSDGALSPQTRESLAAEAFAYTARYDTSIARWFAETAEDFPDLYVRAFEKVVDLPYGENPHQRAAYYAQVGARMHVLSMVSQHHGKQLSYNNLLDLDAARRVAREFEVPACVIVKHNNPCGVAVGRTGAGGLRARLRRRPGQRVRRRHRPQPRGRPRVRREAQRAVHRGALRARLRRRGARGPHAEEEPPDPRGQRAPRPARRRARRQAGPRRPARAGPRHGPRRPRRRWRSSPRASRPSRSGARCSSPGRSAST